MNLLADEGVDAAVVARLRQDGHTVLFVAELEPGISDDLVWDRANFLGALLLTADKDFGELVFRLGRIHAGVVLIRLAGVSAEAKVELLSDAFQTHGAQFTGAFSVVSPGVVRIRLRQ
ncbi:MAG: hypothetical protein EBS05_25000 [Proteobacteria bacterium]|nr:hypothetical protein [Pseudomonadota bacterium]